jgi:hypothetical protein
LPLTQTLKIPLRALANQHTGWKVLLSEQLYRKKFWTRGFLFLRLEKARGQAEACPLQL